MTFLQRQDLVVGVVLVFIGLLTMFVLIPVGVVSPGELEVLALSPTFWPMIVSGVITFCGLVICAQSLISRHVQDKSDLPITKGLFESLFSVDMFRAAITLGLFLLYYWSIERVGIVLASIIAIITFTLYGGERRFIYIASISLLLPILLYYFFTLIANVPLPLGWFEQWR